MGGWKLGLADADQVYRPDRNGETALSLSDGGFRESSIVAADVAHGDVLVHFTKAGNREARRMLIEAAWSY